MRFLWTQSMPSTQVWLADYVRNIGIKSPFIVATREQTNGIGSRSNTWDKVSCGLYLSSALPISLLPQDLPRQSSSIYFGQILLELLQGFCGELWLKWPNDFYLHDYKVGGLITQYIKGCVVFGIGVNIFSKNKHSLLTDSIKKWYEEGDFYTQKDSIASMGEDILSAIIRKILHFLSFNIVKFDLRKDVDTVLRNIDCNAFLHDSMAWHEVFKRYERNFHRNKRFYTHINDDGHVYEVSLQDAALQSDGSIALQGRVLYSLR